MFRLQQIRLVQASKGLNDLPCVLFRKGDGQRLEFNGRVLCREASGCADIGNVAKKEAVSKVRRGLSPGRTLETACSLYPFLDIVEAILGFGRITGCFRRTCFIFKVVQLFFTLC